MLWFNSISGKLINSNQFLFFSLHVLGHAVLTSNKMFHIKCLLVNSVILYILDSLSTQGSFLENHLWTTALCLQTVT